MYIKVFDGMNGCMNLCMCVHSCVNENKLCVCVCRNSLLQSLSLPNKERASAESDEEEEPLSLPGFSGSECLFAFSFGKREA